MAPLLQSQLDGQQFSIANVIIVLRWGEAMGEKGTRVYLLILG